MVLVAGLAVVSTAGADAPPPVRFSAPVSMPVGRYPFRVVAADLNRDGNPDLATADNGSRSVSVLLGRGDGSFHKRIPLRVARDPADVAAGDLDDDGLTDLVSAGADRRGSVTVLLNRRHGHFRRAGVYRTGAGAPAVALADVDGDGRLDILTANLGQRDLTVLRGRGHGRFRHPVSVAGGDGAVDVEAGDLNGDGAVDVMLATAHHGNAVTVRLNDGHGSFAAKRAYRAGRDPDGLALADLDLDGRPDIIVTNNEGGSISVLRGAGDGTFGAAVEYSMSDGPDAVAVADFNGDGRPDLVTSAFEAAPAVAPGLSGGVVGAPQSLLWEDFQGMAVADFNHDRRPDLAMADISGARFVNVLLNWTGLTAAPCVVPRVRRSELANARLELELAGCRLGRISYRHARTVRRNRVIAQRPRPAAVLPSRSRVNLVVSRDRRT